MTAGKREGAISMGVEQYLTVLAVEAFQRVVISTGLVLLRELSLAIHLEALVVGVLAKYLLTEV